MDLQKQLDQIDQRLKDIQTGMAEIRAIYDVQQKRLDRLEAEVWGNGRAGLAAKVNAIIYGLTAIGTMTAAMLGETIAAWWR